MEFRVRESENDNSARRDARSGSNLARNPTDNKAKYVRTYVLRIVARRERGRVRTLAPATRAYNTTVTSRKDGKLASLLSVPALCSCAGAPCSPLHLPRSVSLLQRIMLYVPRGAHASRDLIHRQDPSGISRGRVTSSVRDVEQRDDLRDSRKDCVVRSRSRSSIPTPPFETQGGARARQREREKE